MPLFDATNRLTSDSCTLNQRNTDNAAVFDYTLLNLRPDGGACGSDKPRDPLTCVAVKHPNLVPWTGYGWNTCAVDTDTQLRINSSLTNTGGRHQLSKRVFEAGPNLSHGTPVVDVEARLRGGLETASLKGCARVSEKDFQRFVPGVCKVGVEHIVPTFWVNGGASSRDIARSDTFLNTMGYAFDGKAWRRAGSVTPATHAHAQAHAQQAGPTGH